MDEAVGCEPGWGLVGWWGGGEVARGTRSGRAACVVALLSTLGAPLRGPVLVRGALPQVSWRIYMQWDRFFVASENAKGE